MPLFTQNGSLLRAGNSLRGCCCDHVEPPPPPPPPEPPGPEPPPPPIPPGNPPPNGCGCCMRPASGSVGDPFPAGGWGEHVCYFGNAHLTCEFIAGFPVQSVTFDLDGDHTCSDDREHGLRDEYIVGKFTVGQRPVFEAGTDNIVEHCYGSLGYGAHLRTFYNRYSSCSGDAVDDNARTPQTLVTYTVMEGVANINGNVIEAGQSYTAPGIPFNPGTGVQTDYTGGRVDFVSGQQHMNPGTGRTTVPSQIFIPPHISSHASIMSVHRLAWYHHDDYDVYLAVACASGG